MHILAEQPVYRRLAFLWEVSSSAGVDRSTAGPLAGAWSPNTDSRRGTKVRPLRSEGTKLTGTIGVKGSALTGAFILGNSTKTDLLQRAKFYRVRGEHNQRLTPNC